MKIKWPFYFAVNYETEIFLESHENFRTGCVLLFFFTAISYYRNLIQLLKLVLLPSKTDAITKYIEGKWSFPFIMMKCSAMVVLILHIKFTFRYLLYTVYNI